MKVLVVGGGGREHALVWKIAQSSLVSKIYVAPGNGGMGDLAECLDIAAEDVDALFAFAKDNNIDLTVVGPEAPLALGIVDKFEQAGLKIFGPSQKAAEIEGSKALAKEIMLKYSIPTAGYQAFTDKNQALAYLQQHGAPVVVKADGLAAGKGVVVAMDLPEAIDAVESIMGSQIFGSAGNKVVIEDYLEGEEVSVLAFTDGKTVIPMVSSQDHKRVFDGDQGPNTGGMGAYSPAPIYTEEMAAWVESHVLQPTVDGMKAEGRLYKGVLYAGLMVTAEGVKVLEYNARFGDPETQAVLARLDSDLVEIMLAIVDNRLADMKIKWKPEPAVCVVVAAGGYPNSYAKGEEITGLDQVDSAIVFHAGTVKKSGKILTNGGRVLGVTAYGSDIKDAIHKAYAAVDKISFKDCFCRKDIGYRAIK